MAPRLRRTRLRRRPYNNPMKIIHGIYSLKPCHKGCVLTVGNFDGVHHGHRMLLDHLFAKARERASCGSSCTSSLA